MLLLGNRLLFQGRWGRKENGCH
uniref:Uncharacterized protein n=1 Tax=Anguilla anguilla TaxID=7936 RepID=A0A0E9S404_ANGAN